MAYGEFFKKATGFDPSPYQTEVAEGTRLPIPLKGPAGADKTEAAILGWIERYTEAKGPPNLPPPTCSSIVPK